MAWLVGQLAAALVSQLIVGRVSLPQALAAAIEATCEFALAGAAALRPVSQVMGTCVFAAKWAADRVTASLNRDKTYRLDWAAYPWNAARQWALRRLWMEAKACGADAVVGVQVRHDEHQLAASLGESVNVEFVAIGTAVAREGTQPTRGPVLTGLSMQGYWKLFQGGFDVVGVAARTVVVGRVAGIRRETHEVAEFSDAVRAAYSWALADIRKEGERLGAEGITGIQFNP